MQGAKWKMSKQATENMLYKINNLLGITESYKAPERLINILSDQKKSKEIFFKFLETFDYDLSYEWFNQYFEDEHADRKNKKQDFTPNCLSKLMTEMFTSDSQKGIIYEPACGTGSTIIAHWYRETRKSMPWEYNPMDYLYFCEELSSKTVPFLIFNLMIRGMNAVVIHGNTLTKKAEQIYHIFNENNHLMEFSTLFKCPHTKYYEDFFGIKFVKNMEQ